MVPHHELHAVTAGLKAQLHRPLVGCMAQGVVQEVTQCGNRQHRGHFHRGMGDPGRQLEPDALTITTGRILYGEFRHLLGTALHTIVKRQAALDSRQQQQLFEGAMQTVGALFGPGQGLIPGRAFGHARHLQVGLDRGQRAAQFMGGVTGQPTFAFDGLADALEQLVLRVEQGLQFAGQRLDLQRLKRVRAAAHQGVAHAIERRQSLADAEPEQAQATEQCHAHRHRSGQQDRHVQRFAFDLPVGRGDPQVATGQGETAPRRAIDDLVVEAHFLGFQGLPRITVTAGEDFPAQRTDLTCHATRNIQLFSTEMSALALARQRRQLLHEPGDHARRGHQALVEGKHHLIAQIAEHPGRGQRPDQGKGAAKCQAQAQTQAHHFD
ncbi:hypothetical protein D3C76_741630 [compost metagenome]